MATNKHIDKICIAVIVLVLILTVLFMNGEKLGIQKVADSDAEGSSGSEYFTKSDLNGDWSGYRVATIVLNGSGAKISGNGAYFNDNQLMIVQSGYYEISGELTDGSIIVEANASSKVWIRLCGVKVTCEDSACLLVKQADKVFLTLKEDTDNAFISGENYSEEAISEGINACIYARDDLTINGGGTLTVTGSYRHGIKANDDLVIAGGQISITGARDAIHVNDSFRLTEATLNLIAGDEGIDLDGNEEEDSAGETGYFYALSGKVTIDSADDGIHTAGNVTIDGGDFEIASGDDGIHSDASFVVNAGSIFISECYEGIEAITITQTGGDVTIYCSDDGLNANGNTGGFGAGGDMAGAGGGQFQIGGNGEGSDGTAEGDFGSGERPEKPDGTESFEGEDGDRPERPDGTESSEGEDGERPERPDGTEEGDFGSGEMLEMQNGEGMENTESGTDAISAEETWVRITGGTLTIINRSGQDADGIDSNGSIYLDGGTIRISLVGNGSNCALDFGSESGGACIVTGGNLIACGGASMLEEFDEGCTQPCVIWVLDGTVSAGTEFTVTDEEGIVILSFTPECSFQAVSFSCSEMKVGSTYVLSADSESESVTLDSMNVTLGTAGNGGMVQPGR